MMTTGSGNAGGGSPAAGDAGPSATSDTGNLNYLPKYNGSRRQGAYKERARTVQADALAFDVPAKQLAPRVRRHLRG